ncbi:unnamed protein product [Spirodela intermedia]|uniref:Uncharacterized protein n=2 Tax=Spirodela intermedia TaxID=51605 RepID=A0A7I8JRU2_SPIIN|nr:unnamed protein product [Spirodela intermedia]CAA6672283.1 unnamed protein product [Spirodela intermedia]CAA7401703.1 unnamed protein product [Spirodela intermedia]
MASLCARVCHSPSMSWWAINCGARSARTHVRV